MGWPERLVLASGVSRGGSMSSMESPFEGLPSHILSKSANVTATAHTGDTHKSHSEASHSN